MAKHALDTDMVHTADVVALATVQNVEHVLLVRRAHAPYAGYWAFPGGHVDPGEHPLEAAVRELDEETGLHLDPEAMSLVGVYDTPGRDPRGHYASRAFSVRLHPAWLPVVQPADDAAAAEWIPTGQIQRLAFDHDAMLRDALGGAHV